MDSILIITGETSGERYGACLVREFKLLHPDTRFFGIGGNNMRDEGVELLFSIQDLSVVGLIEIISQLPRIRKIFKRIKKFARLNRPAAAVLIDSPDFNLRLAKALKRLSIPVLYYISPTVWAWRQNRLRLIKKAVSKMLLIFPFEEPIYRRLSISHRYIGHPLIERLTPELPKKDFYEQYHLDPKKILISLLPGSRPSEIKNHMPILMRSAIEIQQSFSAQFVLLLAENLDRRMVERFIPNSFQNFQILEKDRISALKYSQLALSSCGTANLECALLQTPVISFYRLSPVTYFLGIHLVKIRNYSIVNILAGKKVIPELIQKDFSVKNLTLEASRLLHSESLRLEMLSYFQQIKEKLGELPASRGAASELSLLISKNSAKEKT